MASEIPIQEAPAVESCNVRHLPPVFEFNNITLEDVISAIDRLSGSKSCAGNGITSFMLKSAKYALGPILLFMYNLSVISRTFPVVWKVAKVRPLFESGSTDDLNNFRPISIIPTVGKVIERIIHRQSVSYLENNHVLSEAQSGFRGGRSTGTCLVDFLDNIY